MEWGGQGVMSWSGVKCSWMQIIWVYLGCKVGWSRWAAWWVGCNILWG